MVSTTTTLLVQCFTRRAAHTARLWEQRVEVYEFMLSDAASWRYLRRDDLSVMRGVDLSVIAAPHDPTEDSDQRRLRVRLSMFGEPDVREAFERSRTADLASASAFRRWNDAAKLNAQVERGEVPAHQAVSGSELLQLRKAAEAANQAADAKEVDLIDAVHQAVERIPRYGRMSISGWVRRKRSTRKQLKAAQAEITVR